MTDIRLRIMEATVAQGRAVSNPLALAVLSCLRERPMHPYEMATTMRQRGKERSIKLRYGSLYTVVDNLARRSLIEPVESRREGRRPERTVYQLTEAGRTELEEWMAELIAVPVKEYPQFEAALSELPVLSPDDVATLLARRVATLADAVEEQRRQLAGLAYLPRLVLLETEYHLAMREAELAWVRALLAEFEDGSFPGLDFWRRWQATGEAPPGFAELAAGQRPGGEDGERPG